MPLSEDEQRILSEIEQQLYEDDPRLAHEVGSTTVYTHALRDLRWSVVVFAIGVVFLLVTLSTHVLLAFVGFLIMLGSALWFERSARALGRAGMQQMTTSWRGGSVRDYFGLTGNRMRDRFKRDEEAD